MEKLDVLVPEKEEEVKVENIEKINCVDLENKFIHVRVGDAVSPATDEQVEEMTEKLEELFKDNGINCITFVTHHAVSVEIIEKKGI